ncbi:hypothetical protein F2Q69_00059523 [Brassica cretica]|uniref:Uncharacterized protein n=1 Tax=Brassica cretica TaxID=69181 RepID=A0A8S9RER5_BRACR|nr:hypothetical protein F2Q69_00059523 [Brassica cretica]
MEGSPYQKFSFSRGKGAVLGTGPEVFRSGEPGCLLAGTRRPVSYLGSGEIQYLSIFSPTTGGVLPTDQANHTRTQQDGQQHQEREEEVESSNANRDGDQQEAVDDGTAKETTTPSKKDLLEAIKVMRDQVAVMAQLFTPLVNSSVGQATPVVTATPIANGLVRGHEGDGGSGGGYGSTVHAISELLECLAWNLEWLGDSDVDL